MQSESSRLYRWELEPLLACGQAIKATLGVVNRRQEEPGSLKEAVALVFAGIFTQRLAPRALMLQNYSFMSHEMSAWFSVNMCLGHSEQTCALNCLNTLRQRQSPQLHFDLMT